VGRPGPH